MEFLEKDQFDTESSSLLTRAEYDPLMHYLHVWFKNSGAKYTYKGVPEETWAEFKGSESKGKYFHAFIKQVFSFQKEG
ncbi:MAG: KTSC domain-containing protein [Proteobacteria bacterium]|nr:KTSC domain-containing protein [Pseudomonadota bacterium]